MITLKHICREFDIDPYPLRQKLRANIPKRKHQRWRWQPDDPELKKVRELAAQMKQKKGK
jgi:hypothetical protein